MMQQLRVMYNGQEFLSRCDYNGSMLFRMRGLLGRHGLDQGQGILLKPCNQIHMFFMKFPIDAIFLDRNDTVVHICHDIRPWRISRLIFKAVSVIECSSGMAKDAGILVGDQIEFVS